MANTRKPDKKPKILKFLANFVIKFFIPAVVIILALAFAKHQMETKPKAKREKSQQQAKLVAVQSAVKSNVRAVIPAMGTVVPAQKVTLNPQVSGRIVSFSSDAIPGGILYAGQKVIGIDPNDYAAVCRQRESELATAQMNLKLELGNQAVAKTEYDLLGEVVYEQDRELVLRQPHLESAQAALEAAKAAVSKAQLDLRRCSITAPFNAIVEEKLSEVGAYVSASTSLLTLTGTDEYWVEVSVPVSQLKWIDIPKANERDGSEVKIFHPAAWGKDTYRRGKVIRLMGSLESEGRMARLLVSVKDPLSLVSENKDKPRLLIGSYVRVEIQGEHINSVIGVKREHLHDGEYIWIMNEQDRLEIRPVEICFKGKEAVYIVNGVEAGEHIVTTDIAAPVENMQLRLEGLTDSIEPQSKPEPNSQEGRE